MPAGAAFCRFDDTPSADEIVFEVEAEWHCGLGAVAREEAARQRRVGGKSQARPEEVLTGQKVAFLETKRVAGTQTHRHQTSALAARQESLPQTSGLVIRDEYLGATLSSVSSALNPTGDSEFVRCDFLTLEATDGIRLSQNF
jgi:hypothetical protein